jgi:hypothetical protein
VKTKDDEKNSQNKQIVRIFPFFWIFPGIFQKALVGINFFIFSLFFLYFSLNKDKKRCNQKNWHLQLRWDVVYRNTARSLKSVQNFDNFFLYFPEFFWQFWWNQTGQSQSGETICCWAWVTVARWTCADRRICRAMGRHTIWQQGLTINKCRLAIVQSGSKVQITGAG